MKDEYRDNSCNGCVLKLKLLPCQPGNNLCKERKELVKEKPTINRHIDIIPIAQLPVQYIIFDDEGKEIAGYCLITGNVRQKKSDLLQLHPTTYKEAVIWHIYIDPKNRRKSYGRCLVEALKTHYDEVFTQALTDDGKKLLMACGFVREDAEGLKVFRWKKQ